MRRTVRAIFRPARRLPPHDTTPRRCVAGFWLALGAAVLAKGPIGPVLALGTVFGHALLTRSSAALRRLFTGCGVLLFVLLAGSWPAAILLCEPEAARTWLAETIGRVLDDPKGVARHPLY